MKNRIISVLLAVVLGFCVFSASLSFMALASGFQSTKPDIGSFSLTYEEYEKIQSGLIDMVLSWHGLTYEDCALEFFGMVYDKMIVDEFWISGNPPCEYDGNCPMFSSNGVWNENYIDMYESVFMSYWGFSYSREEFEEYIKARLAAETSAQNFVPETVEVNTPISVGSDFFKDVINEENQTLTPKNRKMYKYSWRDLSNEQANYDSRYLGRAVGKNGDFFDGKSFEDGIYVQPYVVLGDVIDTSTNVSVKGFYYTPYQYHVYLEKTIGEPFEGNDDYPNVTYTWYSDALHYLIEDGERFDTHKSEIVSYSSTLDTNGVYNFAYYPFVNIGLCDDFRLNFYVYDTLLFSENIPSSYNKRGFFPANVGNGAFIGSEYTKVYKSDNTSVYYQARYPLFCFSSWEYNDLCYSFRGTLKDFEKKVLNDDVSDYGLLFSSEPFTTTYLFDTARLPANSTVTISGDTVYDYSITDNSTGETSTIYNYVTNNYAYPENSGGNNNNSNSGSGGNVSGNITVGGQVDVGGKVDINVNINGGGNGGINGNIGDYVGDNSDIDTDLDNYLDLVPKLSKSFIDYMKDFFSWLPKEIYGLIILCFIFLLLRVIIPKR